MLSLASPQHVASVEDDLTGPDAAGSVCPPQPCVSPQDEELLRGPHLFKALNLLCATGSRSTQPVEEYQENKMKQIRTHTYQSSPRCALAHM